MYTHDFNVYETLTKLDGLLEAGHDHPTPMDRAEYRVLTNSLVQGTAELLRHLALHDVLALETAESFEQITSRQVSTAETSSDGGFSDEIVTIALPAHLVPYGAILESLRTWNVGTIETVADLAVVSNLWARYLDADPSSDEENAIYDQWWEQAKRLGEQCLPAVQRLDAAGLLRVNDLRTGKTYRLQVARLSDSPGIELFIRTEPEAPLAARSKAGRRKR